MIVVPDGSDASLRCLDMFQASHPVPDKRSELAARRMLETVRGLEPEDQVVMLLSGGASALLCAPVMGIDLAGKRALTQDLLASGATIAEINMVRTWLSDIKGGKLARACWPARVTTLAISDVVGDRPEVIGSAPTVDVSIDLDQAQAVANKYDLSFPGEVMPPLFNSAQPFPESSYEIIARNMDALVAAASVAEQYGYETVILGDAIEGEARIAATALAGECRKAEYANRKIALLSGGEVTVTIDRSAASTYGGSNREFALALALQLPDSPNIAGLIADTDGIDGQVRNDGPVAGAFVDSSTSSRAAAIGLDMPNFLAEHRSGYFFAELQDELITGPTNTNVNDFRMLLIN
jgi:glycerate-2-kinase